MSYIPPDQPPAAALQRHFDAGTGQWYRLEAYTGRWVVEDGPRTLPRTDDAMAYEDHRRRSSSEHDWYSLSHRQSRSAEPPLISHVTQPVTWINHAQSSTGAAHPTSPAPPYHSGQPSISSHHLQALGFDHGSQPGSSGEPVQGIRPPSHSTFPPRLYMQPDILAAQLSNVSIEEAEREAASRDNSQQGLEESESQREIEDTFGVTTRTHIEDGMQVEYRYNTVNGVQTRIINGPTDQYTDPFLLQHNIRAHSVLLPTNGDHEALFPSFCIRPSSFFVLGRVFMVLWSEPAGGNSLITDVVPGSHAAPAPTGFSRGHLGELVYSKVRRFVVVRANASFCTALPINSYGRRGVAKPNVVKCEHTIIYTGSEVPQPHPSEAPRRRELPMRQTAIRVVPDEPHLRLHQMSRLDLGKPHTIQHNLKVSQMGMVHEDSLGDLVTQFHNVLGLPAHIAAEYNNHGQQGRWVQTDDAPRQRVPPQQSFTPDLGNSRNDREQMYHGTATAAGYPIWGDPRQGYARHGNDHDDDEHDGVDHGDDNDEELENDANHD